MPNTPLVSVVIATYNMARYVPLAIRSVLDQTFTDFDLHIVDDGSTDATPEAVQPFLADPRVTYYDHQNNQGQAKAKNTGIQASLGRFVAFLDADDIWMPDKLSKQLPLILPAGDVGVIYSPALSIDATGKPLPPYNPTRHRGRITGQLLIDNFVCFPSTLVRRECFTDVGMFDEELKMAIDYDLWLRISAKHAFDYTPEPTLYYRVWPGQMSSRIIERYDYAIFIMQRFLRANPGIVSPTNVRQAWAHTYSGRADCCAARGAPPLAAVRDYVRALRYDPCYRPAWRGLLKMLVRLTGGRL